MYKLTHIFRGTGMNYFVFNRIIYYYCVFCVFCYAKMYLGLLKDRNMKFRPNVLIGLCTDSLPHNPGHPTFISFCLEKIFSWKHKIKILLQTRFFARSPPNLALWSAWVNKYKKYAELLIQYGCGFGMRLC